MPVFFHIYEGGDPLHYMSETTLCIEKVMANFGCIVVTLKGQDNLERDVLPPEDELKYRINYKNFPQKVFEDIQDAYTVLTKTNIEGGLWERPYIMPGKTKVFLYGHSFGGYIVLRMATDDDEKVNSLFDGYICGSGNGDVAMPQKRRYTDEQGRYDNKLFINAFDFERKKTQKTMQCTFFFKKNYLEDEEYNQKISPVYHFKNLKKPLLVVHGTEDRQVPFLETFGIYQAAIDNDKGSLVRILDIKGSDHSALPLESVDKHCEELITFISDVISGKNTPGKCISDLPITTQ